MVVPVLLEKYRKLFFRPNVEAVRFGGRRGYSKLIKKFVVKIALLGDSPVS